MREAILPTSHSIRRGGCHSDGLFLNWLSQGWLTSRLSGRLFSSRLRDDSYSIASAQCSDGSRNDGAILGD